MRLAHGANGPRWRGGPVRPAALAGLLLMLALVWLLALRGGSAGYNATVLGDGPVAFWDLSGDGATERDLSAHGHAGAYTGTPGRVRLPDGEPAALFDGHNEYLSIPSSPKFSIPATGKLTWEAWIRPTSVKFSPGANDYVDWMGKCDSSHSCEWEARFYPAVNREGRCNRISAYAFNPGAALGSGAYWQPVCGMLKAGQWLYVVGEYQTLTTPGRCAPQHPGTINIWVNGIPWNASRGGETGCMSQYAITPRAGNSPLNIGTVARDGFFDGAVAKVAIYDTLLSQAEISAHFTAMTGRAPAGHCATTCTTRQ
jgi:hypothetical protein